MITAPFATSLTWLSKSHGLCHRLVLSTEVEGVTANQMQQQIRFGLTLELLCLLLPWCYQGMFVYLQWIMPFWSIKTFSFPNHLMILLSLFPLLCIKWLLIWLLFMMPNLSTFWTDVRSVKKINSCNFSVETLQNHSPNNWLLFGGMKTIYGHKFWKSAARSF